VKSKTALNWTFLSFPQLNRLVTTTNLMDKKTHQRELFYMDTFKTIQLSKTKIKELG